MRAGELEWYDKMDIKHDYDRLGVRAVPHAVARYGAYIAPGAILMPSYVNIGAYVGEGTMVDTWATVGLVRPDREPRPPLGRRGDRRR